MLFLIPAVSGLLLWIFMRRGLEDFHTSTDTFIINYAGAFKNKMVVSIFLYIFFISLLYHGIQQWLAVYFSQKFNFSQFVISMLVTLTSVSGILGELVGGYFSDTLGRVKTIHMGIVLMLLSVILLLLNVPKIALILVMIVWGLGWTLNHAGLSTLLTDVPEQFLNESASLNSSVRFLAGGIGTALGGVLMQQSFDEHFIVFGLGLLVLALFSKNLFKTKDILLTGREDVPMSGRVS
jgi:predicted MFS family arabinose efflux permease